MLTRIFERTTDPSKFLNSCLSRGPFPCDPTLRKHILLVKHEKLDHESEPTPKTWTRRSSDYFVWIGSPGLICSASTGSAIIQCPVYRTSTGSITQQRTTRKYAESSNFQWRLPGTSNIPQEIRQQQLFPYGRLGERGWAVLLMPTKSKGSTYHRTGPGL